MLRLISILHVFLFLCQLAYSQALDTGQVISQYRSFFPKISDRDAKAFFYSQSSSEPYTLGVDSEKSNAAPEGTVTKYHWVNKTIFKGTERDYWIYVPKQYDAKKPACLMIFQDGEWYLFDAAMKANVVLDNLIYKKEVPVIIGLFINPGDKGPGNPDVGGTDNRSVEYDSISTLYPRFLIEEMLPELSKKYNITKDAQGKALVGISSGAICAFNAAWQRPDVFGKVISHCGSFANIRGGDKFPDMIRRTPAKRIRVFLQSGEKDLNIIWGSWPARNMEMAAALEYAGYDYNFVFGKGGHSLVHGAAIFPETLRWIWRDYPKP